MQNNKTTCLLLRSVKALGSDITKLDDQHTKLTDVMAEGERDDFNKE